MKFNIINMYMLNKIINLEICNESGVKLSSECKETLKNNVKGILCANMHRYAEDKQLTRSGLYFAGADNRRLGKKIPDGVDNGILTAQEIAMLDLRGCDLVVLSACQTAQGDLGAAVYSDFSEDSRRLA